MPLYAQVKVNVNGFNYNVYVKNIENRKSNAPVLIFENGWGMDLKTWNTVINALEKVAPVVCYDRAGVGASDDDHKMPTLKNVAADLQTLLKTLNIPPPYIMIGHSLGGVYIRGYAGYFPNEIAGLVFVDPADFTETKEQWKQPYRSVGVPEQKIEAMIYDRLYKKSEPDTLMPRALQEELQVLADLRRTDFAELNDLPIPKVPIYFFVGGKFEVPPANRSKDFDHLLYFKNKTYQFVENWNSVIYESEKPGMLFYISNAGHFVHRDTPEVVIENIKILLKALNN
ncbi:MAG: alpha/beta fold hydrolase [Saprospiraceae bacterium]